MKFSAGIPLGILFGVLLLWANLKVRDYVESNPVLETLIQEERERQELLFQEIKSAIEKYEKGNTMDKNPNHPTTEAMRDLWHTVAAILMHKLGEDHVTITAEDVEQMNAADKRNILVKEDEAGLHLQLVDDAEAHLQLNAEEGTARNREKGIQ